MILKNKTSFIGLVLLILYFLQYFLNLDWHWLVELQHGQMDRRWSGLALAIFIAFQWVLTFTRVTPKLRKHSIKMNTIHKWIGALSPIFFYIHSVNFGFGYLLLLTYIFFANALLGFINLDVIKSTSNILFKGWMIAHVAFSMFITIVMFFHIAMVFYYK